MEIKTFKIRMSYHDSFGKKNYIDELSDIQLIDLNCEYNWIERNCGYSRNSIQYEEVQAYNRINSGFTDDDVIMNCKYEKGFINVTLIVAETFDKIVTCIRNNQLETRTLFDWIKDSIDGQYSDGIGENEVAYIKTNEGKFDVWLDEFITEEQTYEWGFKIGEPIAIQNYKNEFNLPNFHKKYNVIFEKYKSCFKGNKIIDHNNISKYRKELDKLKNENVLYVANKLNEYDNNSRYTR